MRNVFTLIKFFSILILLQSKSIAQDIKLDWVKSFGSSLADEGKSIAVDISGNIYTTGHFFGTIDMDPGVGVSNLTSAGVADIFIQKLDPNGNFVWAKKIGTSVYEEVFSIAVDASANVYITGDFINTMDFDPGTGVFNLSSVGSSDVFILKLDTNGNFVWAKSFGGTNIDNCFAITVDNQNNVYTTGFFNNTIDIDPGVGVSNLTSAGSTDAFIQKLDADGNFVWAKSFGGVSPDRATSIYVDVSGNIFTTGIFQNTVDFDPGTGVFNLSSVGSSDAFIQKLDADGNFVWAKTFGGVNSDMSRVIKTDLLGNIYTIGEFEDEVDFDPGTGVVKKSSIGQRDVFILKLDLNGNFVWAKTFGSNSYIYANSFCIDNFGNVFTVGNFIGTQDFNPDSEIYNVTPAGVNDMYLHKLDKDGNFHWVKTLGGLTSDHAYSILLNNVGDMYLTGSFSSSVDFDPDTTKTFNITSNGNFDFFVQKLYFFETLYVNDDATGLNNGTSWTDAYTSLESALATAHANTATQYEIRVAEGTYKPSNQQGGGARDETFAITRNGISILGGYNAVSGDRDINLYPTILSGDIGNISDNSDNAYHIMVLSDIPNSVTDSVIIDGFTIEQGTAYLFGNFFHTVNGKLIPKYGGGGIFCHTVDNNVVIRNCGFNNNLASAGGGGIHNIDSSPFIYNCSFSNNIGAGVFNKNSNSVINACNFNNGNAGPWQYGGGVCNDGSTVIISSSVFTANQAPYGGGISSTNSSIINVSNCSFLNHASGGGIYNNNATATITNSIFENNQTLGGIYSLNSSINVTSCLFKNNPAQNGGGMFNSSCSSVNIDKSSFLSNSAVSSGGALYLSSCLVVNIKNSFFSENIATVNGGGIYNNVSTTSLTNCVINNNNASTGGGIYNNGASYLTVYNTTLNANTASNGGNSGNSLCNTGTSALAYFVNSILWSGDALKNIFNNATLYINYSDVQQIGGVFTGDGNKNVNPLFVNASDADGTDNVYGTADDGLILQSMSTIKDVGDNASIPMGITTDILGLQRTSNSVVDMGAYEYQNTPLPLRLLSFTANRTNGTNNLIWKTANESNIKNYEVQYGKTATAFTTIKTVSANNKEYNEYTATHIPPLEGGEASYYRIKTNENDGKTEYSKIVTLNNDKQSTINIYPNPAKDNITIQLADNSLLNTEAVIVNAQGKTVLKQKIQSINQLINISALSQGTYFIKFENGVVEKIVVK